MNKLAKMSKVLIVGALLTISTIANAVLATPCTFEIDNDVTQFKTNQFYLTAVSPDLAFQNFNWPTAVLEPNGKMTFTTTFGFPFCDAQGILIGPNITLGIVWIDSTTPSTPYHLSLIHI